MKAIFTLALLLGSSSAFASNKDLDSTRMNCAAVQTAVAHAGAAIVHFGDGLYDRFVAHAGFCATGENTEPMWIPARDTSACMLYVCRANTGGGESQD